MKEQKEVEWEILIALFKATVEQKSMLIGSTKRDAKMIFNRWIKDGSKLLKIIEDNSNFTYLEEITNSIEDSVNNIRNK